MLGVVLDVFWMWFGMGLVVVVVVLSAGVGVGVGVVEGVCVWLKRMEISVLSRQLLILTANRREEDGENDNRFLNRKSMK